MGLNHGTEKQKNDSKKEIIGKWFYNTHNEKAKVTDYKGYYQVELTFENGDKIITDKQKLKLGYFNKPSIIKYETNKQKIEDNYIGKILFTKDNIKYKIIKIIDWKYSYVYFIDYNIYQNVSHDLILSNKIKLLFNKNNAIGVEFTNKNNEKASIIKYKNSKDVDVVFEDGNLCTNTTIAQLKKGLFVKDCENKRSIENMKKKYIGKIFKSKNGETALILNYINNKKVKVKFSDGYECFVSSGFLKNDFTHPLKTNKNINNLKKKYEGIIYKNNKGREFKVIQYNSSNDVLVEFIEDKIRKKVLISSIRKGHVSHPDDERTVENYSKKLLGKTFTSNNGDDVVVIEYNGSKDIKIRFEDGIVSKVSLSKLQIGRFSHPNKSHMNKESMVKSVLGESFINTYGMKAICIEYINCKEVYLQFEDKTIIKNSKSNIIKGKFSHPYHNVHKNKKSFIVYRMLDENNNILYIGRSTQFNTRIYQHFNRHMFEDNKDWYKRVENIQYMELNDFLNMCDTETYLINKYKPIGNNKYDMLIQDDFLLNEKNIIWKNYDMKNFRLYQINIKGIIL